MGGSTCRGRWLSTISTERMNTHVPEGPSARGNPPSPFLTAEWRHLAMLNFEIDPHVLKPLVPIGTELDDWQGHTFVSLVGFLFLNTRVFGVAVPGHRNFEEVNLRFY